MKQTVGYGDATTTGGRVIGASSTTFEKSKRMSMGGDLATCGNCQGTFPIHGTVNTWTEGGKSMVGHLDLVLCPCKQNRVLASSATTIYIMNDGRSSGAVATPVAQAGVLPFQHGGQPTQGATAKPAVNSVTGASTEPRICPDMTDEALRTLMMQLRDKAVALIYARVAELGSWTPAAKARVQTWFGRHDGKIRQYLLDRLPKLAEFMQTLRPQDILKWTAAKGTSLCDLLIPFVDDGYRVAQVCPPDNTRVIYIYPPFCTLHDDSRSEPSRLSTLVHECTHFEETFGAVDVKQDDTGPALLSYWAQHASGNSPKDQPMRNAASIAYYIALEADKDEYKATGDVLDELLGP
ncbi:hypothetical protein R75461_07626 [Paraburkholderia nemoris]|uniref:M35 family metallo-endopeptidase n=1 Tax=Paraburkholderia nemoris TaxID=2793076 RepID=UPI00190A9A2A|nr:MULTISPECIES: M35 family metallo-endopeptidase [Paraburkholderia]MBK3786424.1 hypothetical protein [Paraburkholderia aspalathi]CAE6854246.1 hypothetical protein R75461_07626 [Paraburkholderia nemoris]